MSEDIKPSLLSSCGSVGCCREGSRETLNRERARCIWPRKHSHTPLGSYVSAEDSVQQAAFGALGRLRVVQVRSSGPPGAKDIQFLEASRLYELQRREGKGCRGRVGRLSI